MKAFALGILASLFFSLTFLLNRKMNLNGDSWIWSASLRYFYMFLLLLIYMMVTKKLPLILQMVKKNLLQWLLWSTVGFGFFYAFICFASVYGSSWLVASSWQITIVAGAIITPFFYELHTTANGLSKVRKPFPTKPFLASLMILFGVLVIFYAEKSNSGALKNLFVLIPVIIAAFSYPLGNRKIIELNDGTLSTMERVFAMTLCSLPFWIILSLYAGLTGGLPGANQLLTSVVVAVFSGIIATGLFFKATDLVRKNTAHLAIIESTQAGEVLFTLLGSIFMFKNELPNGLEALGILIVTLGMIVNGIMSKK